MNRAINTDKSMLELNDFGSYDFPFLLLHIVLSDYVMQRFPAHWHPQVEILHIQEGSMSCRVNQVSYHLEENDTFIINKNQLHSGHAIDDNECKYLSIDFNPVLLYGFEQSSIAEKYVFPVLDSQSFPACHVTAGNPFHKKMSTLIRRIADWYDTTPPCYEIHIKAGMLSLWAMIYDLFCIEANSPVHSVQIKRMKKVKEALTFISENYQENISLDMMAEACHTSKSNFCRIFKDALHKSPVEYLIYYRIQKSLPLLAEGKWQITQISEDVGFSGSSYYSEMFRKYMGCSPSEYQSRTVEK